MQGGGVDPVSFPHFLLLIVLALKLESHADATLLALYLSVVTRHNYVPQTHCL